MCAHSGIVCTRLGPCVCQFKDFCVLTQRIVCSNSGICVFSLKGLCVPIHGIVCTRSVFCVYLFMDFYAPIQRFVQTHDSLLFDGSLSAVFCAASPYGRQFFLATPLLWNL